MVYPEIENLPRLLLAEHIDPDVLERRGSIMEVMWDLRRPANRYEWAWNTLEYGLAARMTVPAAEAYDGFRSIGPPDHTRVDPGERPFPQTRLALAYETLMLDRLAGMPPDRHDIGRSYYDVAALAHDMVDTGTTDNISGARRGIAGELFLLGGLLSAKDPLRVPYPSSPREEAGHGTPGEAHDCYELIPPAIGKVCLDVKLTKKANKLPLTARHPDVRQIRMMPLIRKMVMAHPEMQQRVFDIRGSERIGRNDEIMRCMARMMLADAAGDDAYGQGVQLFRSQLRRLVWDDPPAAI